MRAVFMVLLGCVVWAVAEWTASAYAGKNPAGESAVQLASPASGGAALREERPADTAPATAALGIHEFVRLVRERNQQIAYQDAEWAVSREAIKGAKAIFEPALLSSYQYQDDRRRNTIQELVSQGFAAEYWERSGSYQAALEGLVPTGGRLRLGYTQKDFLNSVADRYGVLNESQTVVGLSVAQPLLKGGGIRTTKAGIEVAEADADIAFQNYRGQMMRVISEAMVSYWDLALANEKYRLRKNSEHHAGVILEDNRVRVRTGRRPLPAPSASR